MLTLFSRRRYRPVGLASLLLVGAGDTALVSQENEASGESFAPTHQVGARIAPCLAFRQGPGSDWPQIDCLPPRTELRSEEMLATWMRASLADGREGWVALDFVAEMETGAPVPVDYQSSSAAAEPSTTAASAAKDLPSEVQNPELSVPEAIPAPAEAAARPGSGRVRVLEPARRPELVRVLEPLVAQEEERVDVAEVVGEWARAWKDQRVENYLSFYSPDFVPADGSTRRDWESLRRERVSRPAFIRVALSSIAVEPLTQDRHLVRFSQLYQSDTFRDRVTKVLELVWVDQTWRIVAERVEG